MSLQTLRAAASTLAGHMHVGFNASGIGYYLALLGLGLLFVFAAGFAALLTVRIARRVADMTPGELLKSLLILAGILIVVGIALP
ncbi:MAG: hypothetical protein LRS48_02940 [Desulfurococcales archaeon]|nr:hypothetical protein [Desulfurococcales archaeon]